MRWTVHMRWIRLVSTTGLLLAGFGPPALGQADDLAVLSDEFDDAGTLTRWRRVDRDEQWGTDQLQRYDIGRTRPGWMTMVPYSSSWYRDYRGILSYKPVAGDFVVTTRLRVSGRSGQGAPRALYSLAGIMVRAPRDVTPRTWQPGGENYIFLSFGSADRPGTYQYEVKTTINSDSQLAISPADGPEVLIQTARIGPHFLVLRKAPDGPWIVHRRYHRPDLPARLQVGLTCYTDWPSVERLSPPQHNTTVIRGGNPDLIAQYDFVRLHRPDVPAALRGRNLSDAGTVPDAELLRFLGEPAAAPSGRGS